MKTFNSYFRILALVVCAFVFSFAAGAQTSTLTYQGRLTDTTLPANGTYDFQFALYDAASGGTQQPQPNPPTLARNGVAVNTGVFTVQLDFGGAAFPGADRFLEIRVKKPTEGNYTTLAPRQQITSSPYAIRTLSAQTAATADALSANCVGCVTNGQIGTIDGSKVTGSGSGLTNLNASNLTAGTVPLARLGTNTPTPNTFLRSDNTFASVAGFSGVTLQVEATNTATQSITVLATSASPAQNVSFNNIITAPTSGTFDGTTFRATTAGLYLITALVNPPDGSNLGVYPEITVNGTPIAFGNTTIFSNDSTTAARPRTRSVVAYTFALNANDAVVVRAIAASTSTASPISTNGTTRLSIVRLN